MPAVMQVIQILTYFLFYKGFFTKLVKTFLRRIILFLGRKQQFAHLKYFKNVLIL